MNSSTQSIELTMKKFLFENLLLNIRIFDCTKHIYPVMGSKHLLGTYTEINPECLDFYETLFGNLCPMDHVFLHKPLSS